MENTESRAVIWDMDGVIVDTGDYHFRSWQYAFSRRGVEFTGEDFKHIFGQRNDTIVRKIIGSSVTQMEIDAISNDKEENFRQIVKQGLKPFPGVIDLLGILKEDGIYSAIASSAPLENIQLIINILDIKDYFQTIVYGKEVSEGKPSPKIFLRAAQKLGVEVRRCIVIEDAVAGVTAAKNARMRCIAVTNTHTADSLSGADLVVDSLENVSLKDLNQLFDDAK